MTQTNATNPPPKRPARHNRPAPGTPVQAADHGEEKGVVTASDDWWDTFQLGGTPLADQVLVEWPRGGSPVRRWELISDLTLPKEGAK